MTPMRMVSVCAGLLITSSLFMTLVNARNDLPFRTRSVIKQMQKAEDSAEGSFLAALRYPGGNLIQQEEQFGRAWSIVRRFQLESTEWGQRGRKAVDDGHRLPYGEVLVHGKVDGQPRLLRMEWVSSEGHWYLYNFRDR
jgi:hypothetical protein